MGAWPWFAVAGVGALHGLNPASGWVWAAAWGVRSGDRSRARHALLPIAIGHIVSLTLVAGLAACGAAIDRATLLALAVAMAVPIAIMHLSGGRFRTSSTAHAGLALGSFIASIAHGTGMMLVPALIPLCIGGLPGREIAATGSVPLVLASVGVHMAAMLTVSGLMAVGACRLLQKAGRWVRHDRLHRVPNPAPRCR